MASEEANGEPSQPFNHKTWFLRVSVHCEGCKKKVKKILSHVPGVLTVDIDIRQQRVMVIGDVEADTLIRKLLKSGKTAELWPEQPLQKEKKPPGKSKYREEPQADHHHQDLQKNKEIAQLKGKQPSGQKKEANPPAVKIEAFKKPSTKKSEETIVDFDVNVKQKSKENDDGVGTADKAVESNSKDSGGGNQEKEQSKSEGKKVEKSATSQPLPEKSCGTGGGGSDNICDGEKSTGGASSDSICNGEKSSTTGGGGRESGKNVKKKKSKGQNGNFSSKAGGATPSSNADKPANVESHNHHNGGPHISLIPANDSPPRHFNHHHHHQPHGSHHYVPSPSPSYGLSYNTSYPTNTYTTSFYVPSPPPNAYIYSYPGPEGHPPPPPPPSDPNLYPSQPLDSFEIFSDENPNGCLVM